LMFHQGCDFAYAYNRDTLVQAHSNRFTQKHTLQGMTVADWWQVMMVIACTSS